MDMQANVLMLCTEKLRAFYCLILYHLIVANKFRHLKTKSL